MDHKKQDEGESQRRRIQQYIFGLEEIQEKAEDLAIEHEDLKHSLDLLNAILDTVTHGICMVKDNRFVWSNRALTDIFGWEQEELVGRKMDILFSESEQFVKIREHIDVSMSGAGMMHFEHDLVKKSGEFVPCLIMGRLLAGGGSSRECIFSFTDYSERKRAEETLKRANDELERRVKDRTRDLYRTNEQLNTELVERKRVEEELLKERERLSTVLDGNPIPTFMIDQHHRIVFWNRALEAITLVQREYALGRTLNEGLSSTYKGKPLPILADLILDMTDEELLKNYVYKIRKTKSGESFEVTAPLWSGGEKRMLEILATRIRDHQGEVVGVIQCAQDVTDRMQLQKQLHHAQKIEAIGTLAGGIAHDFNNILTAIIGYAQIGLNKATKNSAARRYLERVLDAGNRASDLVGQILAFSRQTEHERKPIQLISILKDVFKLLRSTLPAAIQIRQKFSLGPGEDIILADQTQIQQVFMNLCTNAAHAMRTHGGILSVQVTSVLVDSSLASLNPELREGSYVRLTVSDTGHGMDSATMERIFDPYFTTKVIGEGTGLGLAVVQRIVKNHGGAITVHSDPGRGSTFHVFLPKIKKAVTPEAEPVEELPTGSERILFIDDERMLVELGKEMLESLGYSVTARECSSEALECFRNAPGAFDLVLTDMNMPGLTGIELARELIAIRPGIMIILCTGFSELIGGMSLEETGIHETLMKPYVINNVAKTIRRVLDQAPE